MDTGINPIIYVDGWLADQMGRVLLQETDDHLSKLMGYSVDILTYGASNHHNESRYTGKPGARP